MKMGRSEFQLSEAVQWHRSAGEDSDQQQAT